MSNSRFKIGRIAAILLAGAVTLAVAPAASAGVHVGVGVNIALPPHVHVSVGNYEPYYVGRVFYQPAQVWRPVYSFPVETPYGIEYAPYVYDGPHVVCHDYIPGYEAGYGQFVVEGRGRYDPHWYRGSGEYHAYDRYDRYDTRAGYGHSAYQGRGRRYDDRGGYGYSAHQGHGSRYDDRYERSGSGHSSKGHKREGSGHSGHGSRRHH
jgi:hypothetical protein